LIQRQIQDHLQLLQAQAQAARSVQQQVSSSVCLCVSVRLSQHGRYCRLLQYLHVVLVFTSIRRSPLTVSYCAVSLALSLSL
jgi:hypothetical protein